ALAVQPRLLNRDRDREVRDAVEEVAGSVERIDDEARLGGIAGDLAAFLHQEAPVGTRRAQFIPQGTLSRLVRLRDEVRGALAAYLEVLDFAEVAPKPPPRLARGALHHANNAGNCCQSESPVSRTRRG